MSMASDKRSDDLKKLASLPGDDVDLSDIPELTAQDWQGAERGKFYRPVKQQITMRIDADVLAWIKSDGRGYQGRINAILRAAMLHDTKMQKGSRSS